MSPYSNSTQIFPESPDAIAGFGRQGELREPEVEARLASNAVSDQERGQWFKAVKLVGPFLGELGFCNCDLVSGAAFADERRTVP